MQDHGGVDIRAVVHGEESAQEQSEGLQPMGRTHAGAGEHHERRVAETKGDEMTRAPISGPHAPLRGVGI